MRIDAISIFPSYFDALELSLFGKARGKGLIEFNAHDLRSWTDDRHKTVDDSPYGGGAGMVMMPEPWGKAFDDVIPDGKRPVVIFTTPAGEPFSQAMAQELSNLSSTQTPQMSASQKAPSCSCKCPKSLHGLERLSPSKSSNGLTPLPFCSLRESLIVIRPRA